MILKLETKNFRMFLALKFQQYHFRLQYPKHGIFCGLTRFRVENLAIYLRIQ